MGKYDEIKTPAQAWKVASRLRKIRRIPELEKLIILDPTCSYNYCQKIIKGRWTEAEQNILEKGSPKLIFLYAKNIIKDRWTEAEQKILQSKEYVYQYAMLMKSRWFEGERVLLEKHSVGIEQRTNFWNFELIKYCEEIIKDRWEEAEGVFAKNPILLCEYATEVLEDKLPENLHNMMLCYALSNNEDKTDAVEKYLEFVKETEKKLKKQLKNRNLSPETKVQELLDTL